MAKKAAIRARHDALNDMKQDFPSLTPKNKTGLYKGKSLDWYLTRSLHEIDRLDNEVKATKKSVAEKLPATYPFTALLEGIGLKLNAKGDLMEQVRIDEIISRLNADQMICIGCGSGYFFMGTVAEYKEVIPKIERIYDLRTTFNKFSSYYNISKGDFSHRTVQAIFTRDFPGEPVMIAFDLEGSEFSPLCLYSEYERAKRDGWPFVWPGKPWLYR